jgi:branched-chain amino acid transport system ATP-binding protein
VPLLECRGLTRRFGALVAVDGFDLTVEPGEIRAVIGPNGAGKSTVFNLITSVLKPSAGQVVFAGEDVTGLPVHQVAQKGIARTFQLCHIFPALTVRENVRMAAQAREGRRWQFLGGGGVLSRSATAADEGNGAHAAHPHGRCDRRHASHGDQRLARNRHGDRAEATPADARRTHPGLVDRGTGRRANTKNMLAAEI